MQTTDLAVESFESELREERIKQLAASLHEGNIKIDMSVAGGGQQRR